MRFLIGWFAFPAMLCGFLWAAMVAFDAGWAPGTVVGLGTLGAIVGVVLLERIQPFEEDWNHSKGDVATDAAYLPTYLGVNALIEPGVRVVAVAIGAAISQAFGIGLWPDWPLVPQLLVACVVVEAFDYWPHRWLHEVPALWRFHAIHHNPKRVYWLNATRSHPVETAFRGIVNLIPLAVLGAGEELLALVALTNTVVGLFQHANVDFQLGPLSWIFSVGEMHRWHHSVEMAEANNNYGSNFLFWDVVFGTRYRDVTRRGPAEVGIENDYLPTGWWAQMSAPFKQG